MMGSASSPSHEHLGDLETARAALGCSGPVKLPTSSAGVTLLGAPSECPRSARANRRAGLGLLLVALMVGAVFQLTTGSPDTREERASGSRASVVFSNAESGTCLTWPTGAPDKPSFVQCRDDHRFEVAKAVDMSNFGEPCQAAVQQYLGPRYDPNSKFTIGVLWAGDNEGASAGNLLCGLQLLGSDNEPMPFKGQVAEQDQSKVWATGTCLGLDTATNRSTDVPVDCAAAHAVEVTGAVDLGARFPGPVPSVAEQDEILAAECAAATEAYLAPVPIATTGLTLGYDTVALASWSAGSRQVACRISSPGERGLEPLVGSVKGPAAAGDQAVAAVPPAPSPPTTEAPAPAVVATTAAPEPSPSSAAPPSPESPSPSAPSPSAPEPSPSGSASSPTPSPPTSPPSPPTSPGEPTPAGPPPGPAEAPPAGPQPGVIEIPGLPPIYLPGYSPPPPPPSPETPVPPPL